MGKNPEGVENQRKLQGVSRFKLGLNAQVGSDKPHCGKGHRIPRHHRGTMRVRSTPVARGRVLEGAGEKQQQRQTEGRFKQALQSKPRSWPQSISLVNRSALCWGETLQVAGCWSCWQCGSLGAKHHGFNCTLQ